MNLYRSFSSGNEFYASDGGRFYSWLGEEMTVGVVGGIGKKQWQCAEVTHGLRHERGNNTTTVTLLSHTGAMMDNSVSSVAVLANWERSNLLAAFAVVGMWQRRLGTMRVMLRRRL